MKEQLARIIAADGVIFSAKERKFSNNTMTVNDGQIVNVKKPLQAYLANRN